MYAEHRYQPRKPRAASLGAALLINGAIIAGLIYSAPNIIKTVPRIFTGTNIPIDEPPQPEPKPIEKPRIENKTPVQPRIVTPDPVIKTESETLFDTTKVIPPELPPIAKPVDVGPVATVEPPKPVLTLSPARRDPRYAEDFQPQYPASELRAQRDGRVQVRVLVGTDGRVKAVEQLSATSAAFFDATRRQALSKWRFKPATRGSVAEESWLTLTVTFRLEDQ